MSYEKYAAKLEQSFKEDRKKLLQQLVLNYQEGKDKASNKLYNVLRHLIDQINDCGEFGFTQEELDTCVYRCMKIAQDYNPVQDEALYFFIIKAIDELRDIYRERKESVEESKQEVKYINSEEELLEVFGQPMSDEERQALVELSLVPKEPFVVRVPDETSELRDVKIPKPYTFTQEAKDSYAKRGINLVE